MSANLDAQYSYDGIVSREEFMPLSRGVAMEIVRRSDFPLKSANEAICSLGQREEALQLPDIRFWSAG
jgi:hypothetical protein